MVAFRSLLALASLALVYAVPLEERACTDVTVIYARGTFQSGTIGASGDLGPVFRDDIDDAIGSKTLTFTGVDYPADVGGFLGGGDPEGSQTMADMITSTTSSCPSTKIVVSGYSQGAQLVHNAAALITSTVAKKISAIVMFGDPKNGQTLANSLNSVALTLCNDGDTICEGQLFPSQQHTTYQSDGSSEKGAAFVAGKV